MPQVRRATSKDLDILTLFSCALCRETEGRHPDISVVRHGVSRILTSSVWFALVAVNFDGRVMGEVTVGGQEWSDWSNGLFWWVTSSYVEQKSRGMGVGRLLYGTLREMAVNSRDRVVGIRGAIKDSNDSARAALSSLGRKYNGYVVVEDRGVVAESSENLAVPYPHYAEIPQRHQSDDPGVSNRHFE
jgi:GNAT superfamily N-acetyltransferase